MPPPTQTHEAYRRQRAGDFRAGALGLVVGLALIGWYLVSAPEAASDYVPVEVVPDAATVVRQSRHLYGVRITAADGRSYQVESMVIETSGYSADGLIAALPPGEPVTLWVLDPDAERPLVRGIESARISAGPQTGVAASRTDRGFAWKLGLSFAALGALSVGLGLSRRPPAVPAA